MNPVTSVASVASHVAQLLAPLFSVSASRRKRVQDLDRKIRRIEAHVIRPTEKEYTEFLTRHEDPPSGGGSLSACFGKRIDAAIDLLGAKIQLNRLHALMVLEDTRVAIAAARTAAASSRRERGPPASSFSFFSSSSASIRGGWKSFVIFLFVAVLHLLLLLLSLSTMTMQRSG